MQSFPFTSYVTEGGQYDRAVDSAFLRAVNAAAISDGVVSQGSGSATEDALQVVTSTAGLSVSVKPGCCYIRGAVGLASTAEVMTFGANTGSTARVDTVVARFDNGNSARNITLAIHVGGATAPELTRNSTVYEIGLADVVIPAGATAGDNIPAEAITDTRANADRCGYASLLIGADEFIKTTGGNVSGDLTFASGKGIILRSNAGGGHTLALRAAGSTNSDFRLFLDNDVTAPIIRILNGSATFAGNLTGTAQLASRALLADRATNATNADTAANAVTAGSAGTANYAEQAGRAQIATHADTATTATNANHATTASTAEQVENAIHSDLADYVDLVEEAGETGSITTFCVGLTPHATSAVKSTAKRNFGLLYQLRKKSASADGMNRLYLGIPQESTGSVAMADKASTFRALIYPTTLTSDHTYTLPDHGGELVTGNHVKDFLTNGTRVESSAPSGAKVTGQSSFTASNGTNLCSVTLEPGTWLLVANVRWASNSNGVRAIKIASDNVDMNCASTLALTQNAVQGFDTVMSKSLTRTPASTTTYYLNGAHSNQGSDLSVSASLSAIRID